MYGGIDAKARLSDVWLLDIKTGAWQQVAAEGPAPPPRAHHTATRVGSRIYIFGGWVMAADKALRRHERLAHAHGNRARLAACFLVVSSPCQLGSGPANCSSPPHAAGAGTLAAARRWATCGCCR